MIVRAPHRCHGRKWIRGGLQRTPRRSLQALSVRYVVLPRALHAGPCPACDGTGIPARLPDSLRERESNGRGYAYRCSDALLFSRAATPTRARGRLTTCESGTTSPSVAVVFHVP
jgi:hypothetical protein